MYNVVLPLPEDVVFSEIVDDGTTTQRQRLGTQHSPVCVPDVTPSWTPWAIQLRFDAVGAFRTTERDQVIDTTGAINGTSDINDPVQNPGELLDREADSRDAHTCLLRVHSIMSPA